jgi:hypothetical protein
VTLRFAPEARKSSVSQAVHLLARGALSVVVLLPSCARRVAHPPAEAKSPAPASGTGPSVASGGTSFVVEDCPDAKKIDSKAIEAAMRRLTEPCHDVETPAADFLATLVPGGRIEIASHEKDGAEGVIPICVVKNRLTHSVALKQRCTFNVKLEPAAHIAPATSSSAPAPTP